MSCLHQEASDAPADEPGGAGDEIAHLAASLDPLIRNNCNSESSFPFGKLDSLIQSCNYPKGNCMTKVLGWGFSPVRISLRGSRRASVPPDGYPRRNKEQPAR